MVFCIRHCLLLLYTSFESFLITPLLISHKVVFPNEENSPDDLPPTSSQSKKKYTSLSSKISPSHSNRGYVSGNAFNKGNIRTKTPTNLGKNTVSSGPSPPAQDESSEDDEHVALPMREANGSAQETTPTNKSFDKNGLPKTWSSSYLEDSGSQQDCMSGGATVQTGTRSQPKVASLALFFYKFYANLRATLMKTCF